jgi:CHASE2 domain-containing sensor protein
LRERLESDRASSSRKPLFGRLDWMLAACGGAIALFVLIDMPDGPEHWSSDLVTAFLSEHPKAQDKNIALVYISEETLRDAQYVSPIDRHVLAQLIKKIDEAGAKSIGLDIILDRQTETAKDDELIKTIQKTSSKIIMGVVEEPSSHTQNEHAKTDRIQTGFFLKQITDKGRCGQVSDSRINCGHIYLSVSHSHPLLNTDDVIRLVPEREINGKMSFGEAVARASEQYNPSHSDYISWLLQPKDGSENFFSIDAADIINGTSGSDVLLRALKGRTVLIGGNFKDKDQHFIPLSVCFLFCSEHRYPGLFIHAQYVSQLREGRTLNELPVIATGLIILFLFTGGCYVGRQALESELWLQLAGVLLLVGASISFFLLWNLIFPFAYTVISWLAGVAVGHYGIPDRKNE